MPLPNRRSNESKAEFINRCITDELMNNEYPRQKQRIAICMKLVDREELKVNEYLVGLRGALKKIKK